MSRRGIGGKGLGKSFKVKALKVEGVKPVYRKRKTLGEIMREMEQEGVWEAEYDLDNEARVKAGVDQFMWPGKEAWMEMSEEEQEELRKVSE